MQRIEWMYQDRSAQQQSIGQNNAEDYLLGKTVKDISKNEKEVDPRKNIVPVIRGDLYTTPENEAFVKMMEDPLVFIKQKELEARRQVIDNPLKMKQIRAEIEALKEGKKKKSKKDKKKKKKKDKKNRKSSSSRRSSSSESPSEERSHRRHISSDSNSEEENDRTKDRSFKSRASDYASSGKSSRHRSRSRSNDKDRGITKNRSHRRDSRSSSRERKNHNRDRHERKETIKSSGPQIQSEPSKDLGPDMKLYGEKLRQLEESERLRRKQKPTFDVDNMTEEERSHKLQEM